MTTARVMEATVSTVRAETAEADGAALAALAGLAVERAPFGFSLASARPESFGRFRLVNPAYARFIGYDVEALRSLAVEDVLFPEDWETAQTSLRDLLRGEVDAVDVEVRLRHRDGSTIWVRQHRSLVADEQGAPAYFLVHTEDVSARKRTEAALRESEARYRLFADNAADMIVCTRADATRAYVSPASRTLLGYEPHEIIETDFTEYIHPEDRERTATAYARFIANGGRETHAYRLRRRDGSYVWVEAHWVTAPDPERDAALGAGECVVISVVRDISERKAAEAEIAALACHDPLTGLPNRTLFEQRLGEALENVRRGGVAAVFSIDVDHFKGVNDTHGHALGDALLRAVAERLTSCVRRTDTVARLGGDEFIVVSAGVRTPQEAAACGQRIVDALSAPYELENQRVIASASVGAAIAPADGTDSDVLLRNADVALYRAKADGRTSFRLFEPEMDRRLRAKRGLESELRRALHEDQFALVYQPIVDLATNAVVRFEALVRWRHPERGVVAPGEFIPLAEETGLIVELGAWVLREACREALTWPDGVGVSVNLSPVQFKSGTLVEIVKDALRESGLSPRRLDVEITEFVPLQDHEETRAVLHALRDLGIGVSLDDFGTGYSSLGYIRSFPFSRIKIDRSFVADVVDGTESGAIVHAVIGLARTLGIATVGEGVETPDQLRHLRADGCTEAQGYLFSAPRPSEAIPSLLQSFAQRAAFSPSRGFLDHRQVGWGP